jgi:hypothetical protein
MYQMLHIRPKRFDKRAICSTHLQEKKSLRFLLNDQKKALQRKVARCRIIA